MRAGRTSAPSNVRSRGTKVKPGPIVTGMSDRRRAKVECDIGDDTLSLTMPIGDPWSFDPDHAAAEILDAVELALDLWKDGQRGEEGYRDEVRAAYERRSDFGRRT